MIMKIIIIVIIINHNHSNDNSKNNIIINWLRHTVVDHLNEMLRDVGLTDAGW
jgi:hypothetical protein